MIRTNTSLGDTVKKSFRAMRVLAVIVSAAALSALPSTAATVSAATPPASVIADAAMKGDLAKVRALLASGASVNTPQGDGMTALHWAAARGDSALAIVLLSARANTAASTRIGALMPLHIAAENGSASVVRALLRAKANPRAVTSDSVSALHFAAMGGDTAIVAALLRAGASADVNFAEPGLGQTPLMVAAGRRDRKSVV